MAIEFQNKKIAVGGCNHDDSAYRLMRASYAFFPAKHYLPFKSPSMAAFVYFAGTV
jgi:hypothetical protein